MIGFSKYANVPPIKNGIKMSLMNQNPTKKSIVADEITNMYLELFIIYNFLTTLNIITSNPFKEIVRSKVSPVNHDQDQIITDA